jgi:type I restriction enzyme S subunit
MSVEKVTLGELCTIEKGAIGILKAIPGEYPLVVTGEDRKSHNEFQFDDEAVIIPLVSGTGHGHASIKRIHFQTGKFALGSILCAIIPKDKTKLNAEYLYYFLDLNRENELVARMRGMANVTLPMKEIAKIEIPVPSLDDQIEFVKMYKLLGEKSNGLSLELTHQLNLVKKLRQQLLQDAVQGKLVEQNSNDEPASVLLQKIKTEKEQLIKEKKIKKEKELPQIKSEEIPFDIPKNWVWFRLGDLRNFKYSLSYGVLVPGNDIVDGVPFVRVQDLDEASKNNLPSKKIALEIDRQYSKTRLIGNEILICVVGSIGKIALTSERWIGANIARAVCRFMPSNYLSKEYLYQCLLSPFVQQFFKKSTKSLNPTLNVNLLERTLVPVPPIAEQHRIVQKLTQLMKTCDALEDSIKKSHQQNEQLLQQVLREALTKEVEPEAAI